MKKFVLSVVAAFLITAASAGVAGAQSSQSVTGVSPQSVGTQNTWF
ncbi:hypothetical protein [Streptomyces litchfieldiae]|uniref:Secreted protein n=1 Tax=Streptomyces litchfieldiae TaxID=3075543 RepID=A0ABU2MN19_9ACTN|nr:hypothetical protein [Streptomyces sp. DSM 44938]MDT0343012.1 hypothetical protein [Streptomyces sp. DSM 44938]